jgi:hypothetical protein
MDAVHFTLPHARAVAVLVLAVLVAGCSAATSPARPTPEIVTSPDAAPSAPAGRPSNLPLRTPLPATVPSSVQPVVGEAPPEVVTAARADLAGRVTADAAAAAEVVRAEEVAWPDGSLGCRVPGELYQPLETPGYWIVLRVAGRDYDYRVARRGTPRLCERLLPRNPGG